jgi:hypothetical protein
MRDCKWMHNTLKQIIFLDRANLPFSLLPKERGRNNFRNYASQLQATFARSQIPKASK